MSKILLVFNLDTKSLSGKYTRGDIVTILPSNHEFGKEEGLPTFIHAHIRDRIPNSIGDNYIKYFYTDTMQMIGEVASIEGDIKARSIAYIPKSILSRAENGKIDITLKDLKVRR